MGLPPIGVNQASIVTPFRQTCDTRSGTLFVVSRNEPVGASDLRCGPQRCDKHQGSDRSRNEGAHMAANDRTDTSALRRLHILSGTVPVSRDDRNAPANEPLTLEGVRDRLLVLRRNLHGHCFALSVMRGALAGDDTIREVADVLDQYVLSEDFMGDLETLIAELPRRDPPAMNSPHAHVSW